MAQRQEVPAVARAIGMLAALVIGGGSLLCGLSAPAASYESGYQKCLPVHGAERCAEWWR
jgi:hypothetical protein